VSTTTHPRPCTRWERDNFDPALGRFTQVDPVKGGSANNYDYGAQDPINNIDPSGQQVVTTILPCPYQVRVGRIASGLLAASVTVKCPFVASIRFNEVCINRAQLPYNGFANTSCGGSQVGSFNQFLIVATGVHVRNCPRGRARTVVRFDVTVTATGQQPQRFRIQTRSRLLRC